MLLSCLLELVKQLSRINKKLVLWEYTKIVPGTPRVDVGINTGHRMQQQKNYGRCTSAFWRGCVVDDRWFDTSTRKSFTNRFSEFPVSSTELLLLKRLSTVFAGVSNECLYVTVILMLPIKIPLFLTFWLEAVIKLSQAYNQHSPKSL